MKLDVRKLLSGESNKIDIDYILDTADLPALDDVVLARDAHVTGILTNSAGYMRLSLVCSIGYTTVCARCLKELAGTHVVDFEKVVCDDGDLQDQTNDDYVEINDGMLDIDETIAEDIILNFPLRLLCKDDCKGLCPKCGTNLNERSCSCVTKEIDPRLAPLLKFFEKDENE